MEQNDIIQELQLFIRKQFNVPANDTDFNDEVHLFDYGYVDSFGAVELTNFAESKFSVKIGQNDMIAYPLNTIREIASFVVRRRKGEI